MLYTLGNWSLHLAATAKMLPYFFSMDRQNYARWIPIYLADMKELPSKHPLVHKEFVEGRSIKFSYSTAGCLVYFAIYLL